jgi:hypothetical protein
MPVQEFVDKEQEYATAACTVASWLGLVVRDDTSVLGWMPTHAFVDQVMRRKEKWNYMVEDRHIEPWQEKALGRIYDEALGKEADYKKYDLKVTLFLAFIGLLRTAESGGAIPTKRLLALALERRSCLGEGT